MQKTLALLFLLGITFSCSTHSANESGPEKTEVGTWLLVAKTTAIGDSVVHSNLDNQKSIKILNGTHFAFFTHEKDSAMRAQVPFSSGAGSYTLKGRVYTEFLEYCNFREWENNSFTFDFEVKGDSLIQSGEEEIKELKIKQTIVETYIRVKE